MQRFRIALMCSEKDPLGCHRALLVGRRLHQDRLSVKHIRADGLLETHGDLENRLLTHCKLGHGDMFRDRQACIEDAYRQQGSRVAHSDQTPPQQRERIS